MAKTFDNISEASATNYLFIFSQRTLALKTLPPTPPPLNALGLPCQAVCRLWARLYPEKAEANKYLSVYLKSIGAGETVAEKAAEELKAVNKAHSCIGSWDFSIGSWSFAVDYAGNIAPLAKRVTEYILDHQDDAAQEDRWRTTMKREMGRNFRKQRDEMRDVHTKMDLTIQLVKDLAKQPKANTTQVAV